MPKAKPFFIIVFFVFFTWGFSSAQEVLNWQDCIKEAAKNNPELIAAQESVKQYQSQKDITASTLYPQVTGDLSASTARSANDDTPGATADSYNYGVSGTQLIFDGLKTVNNVNSAKENIKASQQAYRYTSSEVRLSLRTAFINLLTAQELLKVNEDIARIRRGNYELISLRYESGLEHRGALLTAEADLAQANFQIAQARRDIETAQWQMMKAMGRKEYRAVSVKGDFLVVDSAKQKPDYQTLAKNNPSLQEALAKKNSAEFGLRSAYAEFFPSLSGQAGASKGGTLYPPRGDNWNLGLVLSMPIFEGGLRLAQVSKAKALLNQLQADERNTRDGVVVALAQTWAALQDAIETVDVQYKSLIATEERSKIAEAQYSTGFISYDNWTIIEDNLVSAKSSYLNAQSNALTAEASWIQAKGEVLEYAQ